MMDQTKFIYVLSQHRFNVCNVNDELVSDITEYIQLCHNWKKRNMIYIIINNDKYIIPESLLTPLLTIIVYNPKDNDYILKWCNNNLTKMNK